MSIGFVTLRVQRERERERDCPNWWWSTH